MKLILLVFIFLAHCRLDAQDQKTEKPWHLMNLRMGAGLAPDRLFLSGEYGCSRGPWTASFFVAVAPSLSHLAAHAYYQPVEFLEINGFVGRSQYYRTWKGTGLIPLSAAESSQFSRSALFDRDQGQSAGMNLLGLHTTLYWSTLELLPVRLEGLFRYTGKLMRTDLNSDHNIFYDPAVAAPVSRTEQVQSLLFFGAWRVNPSEANPTRLGVMLNADTIASTQAKQLLLSPTLQLQPQGSYWEWFVQLPIKIENPYDERPMGFFLALTHRPAK